jgi:lysozyme family protein
MNCNFERALSLVLKHEGGFVNHPSDPGGATNKGVTIGTYRQYVNPRGTVADLKKITDAQLAKVYRDHYWNAVRGDDLPDGLDYAVFDYAVNSGPARAAKHLQFVLGVAQDGKIGPATLKAANSQPAADVIKALCAKRMSFLRALKTWKTFGKGWTNRVDGVRAVALQMAAQNGPRNEANSSPAKLERKPSSGNWLAAIIEIIAKIFGARK